MADGTQVGSAYIEITPELSRPGLAKARRDIKEHLKQVGAEVDKEFSRQQRDVVGKFNKSVKELQKGKTSPIFKEFRVEMEAQQKLQKQRDAAARAHLKQFEIEKRRVAESIRAQKALADQRKAILDAQRKAAEAMGKAEHEAYAMERKRREAIQKAEIQAYSEADRLRKAEEKDQQRRLTELTKWHEKKKAIEKADAAEALKAAKQHQDDLDKVFKYRTMRGLGMSPEQAAASATGKTVTPGSLGGPSPADAFNKIPAAAMRASSSSSAALEKMSHSLAQLSTRIGLASFQLQLLGGFATTFLTGPAAIGLGIMARDGLKFAVSVGYARASMQALLGPTEDVEKVIQDIKQMAIDSPLFNTEDAISYAQKLASVGVEGKDLYRSMAALSNIMLTQGVAGPERANLAMMAYTQILSKGAIGMDDLRQQFAEHVPGGMKIFEEVARRLGYKTIKGLSDAMKDGEVTAKQLNEEFIKFGNLPKYLKGAENASSTLGGTWQAFREEMQSTLGMAFDANREQIIAAINAIKPVVMGFIHEVVRGLPTLLMWLKSLADRAAQLKAAYDSLSPAQRETIRQMTLLVLASGPAAIAIGIMGTALSALANGASFAAKALALIGIGSFGWMSWIALALGVIAGAMIALYDRSAQFRKAFLQVMNLLKDFVQTIILPMVDILVGSFKSLGRTFTDLGLETKHLAYFAGLLIIPLSMIAVAIFAVIVAVKAFQAIVLVLASALYALLHIATSFMWVFQKLAEGLAKLPATSDRQKEMLNGLADGIEGARKSMNGFVDVQDKWKNLTTGSSDATKEFQQTLAGTNLTVTGLTGSFDLFGNATQRNIDKQITLEQAINNARKAMDGQNSAARSAVDASDSWNKSLLTLRESVKTNKRTLDEKTLAGQQNRDMLKQATQASWEMMLQDIRSGKPMQDAINKHKERTETLKKEFGKSKETQKAAQGLVDTYGKVPPDVETLIRMMGYTDVKKKMIEILAAQKVAKNPSLSYGQALSTERKHWQMEAKEGLKGYRTGGEIRGPGGPTGDKIPILASDEEYMIRAKAAKNLGKPALDFINRYGTLPVGGAFAKGGQVKWPVDYDVSQTKFPEMIGGAPGGGGIGWQRMMAVLRQQFPGLSLISGYRPGAITSTGNKSYHGSGRAVDIPPRMDVFNWISQNYGKSTKELIFTPAGGRQIKNGNPHTFTGGTIQQDHYDHVHWAYDNGGQIKPNTPFINKTGANELALNAAQGKALEDKIANSDRPVYVSVYVDGVRRDAELVFEEKTDELIRVLGGA